MKTYGSAVLTALQAQHKSIEEVGNLIQHRKLQAFINGGSATEWLDCFWQQIAILEANRINAKRFIFYDHLRAEQLLKFLNDESQRR